MRTALITGAAGSIGGATMGLLARTGWQVIATDRAEPVELPPGVRFFQVDLSAADGRERLKAELADCRSLDALINNAARAGDGPAEDITDAEMDDVLRVNLRAPFALMQDMFGPLAEARGSIVNVASVHAVATSRNVASYATSKGALVALTRAVALDWAEAGIRCNAVLPGAVDSAMLHAGLSRREHPLGPAGNLRDLEARTPLGRVGRPSEIAEAISFLADGARSSFITGQTLVVDGGVTARLSSE